jgi:4-hydroxy-tetrahydrodipicolinate reductase
MSVPIGVVIVGVDGRMGAFAKTLLGKEPDLRVLGGVRSSEDLGSRLRDLRPAVGLDFTVAGRGAEHARVMLENGVRPLVGTSGVKPEEVADLDRLARARGLGGLVVPNFCLGIVLQQRFALEAARHFASIEIVEEHHKRKKDAPSGTALDTARRLAKARGIQPAAVPIHSVRIEGLYSNQTVLFGGPGEVLRIEHQNYGLEAFGPGILAALRHVVHTTGVAVGLEHVLAEKQGAD